MIRLLLFTYALLSFVSTCYGADFYISPSGNDLNDGLSTTSPIATFSHSYTLMSPGDTLYLMDGTYTEQLFPPATLSGTAGAYTTFKAVNIGDAIIAPPEANLDASYDTRSSLYVYSNTTRGRMSYFHFDGLYVKADGEHNAVGIFSMDFADPDTEMTHHIWLSNIGALGDARDVNLSTALEVMGSTDILVEDCWTFGFGRKSMEVYAAIRVTVRRVVVRYSWWEGDLYLPNDPRPNITCYNTIDSTFENIISFDAGPHPLIRNPDRSGLVLSGNDAGGTGIQGSSNSGYFGCIVLNNDDNAGVFNGITINGGSGSAVTNLFLKDIVIRDVKSYGINIHDNVDGVSLQDITVSGAGLTGIRVNPDPLYTISNISVSNSLVTDTGGSGVYHGAETTVINTTTARNTDADLEPSYEPTVSWIPTNTPVQGYERGGIIENRYIDRVKTTTPLWPWPNEGIIKEQMCDPAILSDIENAINTYDGTSITYMPGWCATDKTLTDYVWSYLGNPCPSDICTPVGPTRSAGSPTTQQPSGTTSVTLSVTTDVAATCTYGADGVTGVTYPLSNSMTTADSLIHTSLITGLTDGGSYSRSIRCAKTIDSEANDTDYTLSWSVATTGASRKRCGSRPAIH